MPYDEQHFQLLVNNGIRYVSSGVGVERSNAPRTNLPFPVYEELLHVPISTLFLVGGRLKYPIGYGVASRLLPEWLYLQTLRHWLNRKQYFHYYCHTFEMGGLKFKPRTGFRSFPAVMSTKIYMLRCRNRKSFFKSILRRGHFAPIEASLFANAVGHG
jgi:hypothetical protein